MKFRNIIIAAMVLAITVGYAVDPAILRTPVNAVAALFFTNASSGAIEPVTSTNGLPVNVVAGVGPSGVATDPVFTDASYDYSHAGVSYLASAATDTPLAVLSVATIATYPSLVLVSSPSDLWYSTLSTATAAWVWKSHKLAAGTAFTFKIKAATDRLNPVVIASSTGSVADLAIDVVALK